LKPLTISILTLSCLCAILYGGAYTAVFETDLIPNFIHNPYINTVALLPLLIYGVFLKKKVSSCTLYLKLLALLAWCFFFGYLLITIHCYGFNPILGIAMLWCILTASSRYASIKSALVPSKSLSINP